MGRWTNFTSVPMSSDPFVNCANRDMFILEEEWVCNSVSCLMFQDILPWRGELPMCATADR